MADKNYNNYSQLHFLTSQIVNNHNYERLLVNS